MYRVLKPLGSRQGVLYPGTFSDLHWLNSVAVKKLIGRGAISKVAPPPLVELPGWKRRSIRLGKLGIENVTQFLECDGEEIGKILNVKSSTIERWKRETRKWLEPSRPSG